MREILRGYNDYLFQEHGFLQDNIYSHYKFLTYDMAKNQCRIMKTLLLNIIQRQQRKEIPSIINGVHVIPEELYVHLKATNIVYINLYVDSEKILWDRLKKRDPQKYKLECVPLLYQTNIDLKNSILRLERQRFLVIILM